MAKRHRIVGVLHTNIQYVAPRTLSANFSEAPLSTPYTSTVNNFRRDSPNNFFPLQQPKSSISLYVHHSVMPGTNGGQEEKWLAEVLKDSEKAKKGSSSRSGSRIGHPRSTRRTHTNLTGRRGSSSSSSQLPRSVRNAPPALRAEIRRFQNREVCVVVVLFIRLDYYWLGANKTLRVREGVAKGSQKRTKSGHKNFARRTNASTRLSAKFKTSLQRFPNLEREITILAVPRGDKG